VNSSSSQLSDTLAGKRVLLPIDRKSAEMAESLERHGATVTIAAPMRITAVTDDPTLHNLCQQLASEAIDYTVVTTGAGFRALMALVDQQEHRTEWGTQLRAQFDRSAVIARGPKPKGAVLQAGLTPAWTAESETSAEMLSHLLSQDLRGADVVVQHHGAGDESFEHALRQAGARVTGLTTYLWDDPEDPQRVRDSVLNVAKQHFDIIAFTSAPAASRWLDIARELHCLDDIRALTAPNASTLLIAAVGPVTAQPLLDAGFTPLVPERFRMGALIKLILQHASLH